MNYEVQLKITLLYYPLVIGEARLPDSKLAVTENGRCASDFCLTFNKWYDAAKPVQDVLQNRLILQLEEWFPNEKPYIFMQDGAPCHTARSIKTFLAEQNIPLLDWPGNSPDMNPIENIWELMKREVPKDVITNKTQLLERIIHMWNHHPQMQKRVQSCIDSMPRRNEALIAAKGGSTKY
ncbi:transposable element Tcb2 transposase [Trichonephila clavipes]|nr:transposable element Tcb2 transposase [Trichonephila clavipes]